MTSDVDDYIKHAQVFRDELKALRAILLDCGLTEEFKWRSPCYTFQKKNVVIIGELKACCTFSFFKGALIKDPHGILEKPGENSRAARLIRFSNVDEIRKRKPVLKTYIEEAIKIEQVGLKIDFQEDQQLDFPEELQKKFEETPELKIAFGALTPGRQRGYVMFFSAAKQSKTRTARIEKYTSRILDGKGMNDCTCGLSQKMPACDGSHKFAS